MSFECEECGKVSSSAAAILYCDCGDEKPHTIDYRPRRWQDYDE